MLLLDLPTEIVSEILVCAALARGCNRALRMRLVCKRFSREVPSALFASRLLDDVYTDRFLSNWDIGNDHGASKFWHSYLVYRVQNSVKSPQRRYCDIRQVAERICEETGAEMEATVDALCWPALQQGTNPASNSIIEKVQSNPGLDLLCAAAYLNLIPLAKQLQQAGYSPQSESHLFSSPIQLAAWAGNASMLKMFQDHLPAIQDFNPTLTFNHNMEKKVGPASIGGAARRGDIDMVRLAVYPASRPAPDNTDFAGERFGRVDRATLTGNALSLAQCSTRNIEVYQYLEAFFAKPAGLSSALAKHARLGNLEMVRYLLDAGADTRGTSGRHSNPLVEACRHWHEDVVDLLLDRGADPNFDGDKDIVGGGNPIVAAAKSGNLMLVRKLIDRGADLSRLEMGIEIGFIVLYEAMVLEHTDMVRFLLASGFDSACYREILLQDALRGGYDSMVELLQGEGATVK